jgi:hypothetical protein
MISNHDFNAISELDLEPIKLKLMHKPSGEGWSVAKANAVEVEYRRFLCLMKAFPAEETAPLVDVDTFWHYHILDTLKYAADCQQAFGYFLHHYPYVGIVGDEAGEARDAGATRMQELYESTFGDSYDEAAKVIAMAGEDSATARIDHAYCAVVSTQAGYCAAGAGQAAYCAAATKQAAYCAAAVKQAAYCAAAVKQAAYCAAGEKRAAYCAASTKRAAYCAAGTRQSAYCAAVGAARGALPPAQHRPAVAALAGH